MVYYATTTANFVVLCHCFKPPLIDTFEPIKCHLDFHTETIRLRQSHRRAHQPIDTQRWRLVFKSSPYANDKDNSLIFMTIFAPLTTNPVECSANTESVVQRAHNDKRKKAMEEKIVLFSAFWNDADKDFDGGEGAEINSLELTCVPFGVLASHLICSPTNKRFGVSTSIVNPHELWHEITSEEHLLCCGGLYWRCRCARRHSTHAQWIEICMIVYLFVMLLPCALKLFTTSALSDDTTNHEDLNFLAYTKKAFEMKWKLNEFLFVQVSQ